MIRSGFARKTLPERIKPNYARLTVPVHQARISGDVVVSCPKDTAMRNPALLALARGMPCLMQVPGVCNNDSDTVISAHSNQAKHGKAKARKAHDYYSAWACSACHSWLDTGPDTREDKEHAFSQAHWRQVGFWNLIAADKRESLADRKAAQWAIDELL